MTSNDLEFQIAKLSLGPRDVLVVKVKKPVNTQTMKMLSDRMRKQLPPGTHFMVIIDDDIELSVIEQAGNLT